MPLPNTRVIPAGWSQHHRPVTVSAMTGLVVLYAAADPTAWPAAVTDTVLWEGPARIQALTSATDTVSVDQASNTRPYLVAVPLTGFPTVIPMGEPGAYLVVKENPDDPAMVGHKLTVRDVQHGSLAWERDLVCDSNLTTNNG